MRSTREPPKAAPFAAWAISSRGRQRGKQGPRRGAVGVGAASSTAEPGSTRTDEDLSVGGELPDVGTRGALVHHPRRPAGQAVEGGKVCALQNRKCRGAWGRWVGRQGGEVVCSGGRQPHPGSGAVSDHACKSAGTAEQRSTAGGWHRGRERMQPTCSGSRRPPALPCRASRSSSACAGFSGRLWALGAGVGGAGGSASAPSASSLPRRRRGLRASCSEARRRLPPPPLSRLLSLASAVGKHTLRRRASG